MTFLKELMLIKQVHQKRVMFVTIGSFKIIVLSFYQMSDRCHDLLMSINLSDIAILNIKGSDYHCIIISSIRKNEAINLLQNADLTGKSGTL